MFSYTFKSKQKLSLGLIFSLMFTLATNLAFSQTPSGTFQSHSKETKITSKEMLAQFESPVSASYTLDSGDEIFVEVVNRQEISGKQVLGPDGNITMPLIGTLKLSGLTREEAAEKIIDELSEYYLDLAVTVKVEKYTSNKVFILGRVANPGALVFDNPPTLLEAITRAGSLPVSGAGSEKAALTRCSVFRGKDKVVWLDLKNLLSNGDMSINIRLQRNDIIYIPDADDQLIYVLGEVKNPGAYRLTPDMAFMDAIAQAGGPSQDAASDKIHIVRPSKNISQEISLKQLLKANNSLNFSLEEGDIIYVPKRNLAKFGYFMEKISPAGSLLLLGKTLLK
jgi:polysaccharide export outer membrane protein